MITATTSTDAHSHVPGIERRRAERFSAGLRARWEGVLARRTGEIVDLSSTGCFILTSDDVETGEMIRIEIVALDGRQIFMWGEVVYQHAEMGFALRFTGANAEDEAALEDLLIKLLFRKISAQL